MIATNTGPAERVFNMRQWAAFIAVHQQLSQEVARRRSAMHTAYRAKTRRRGKR